MKHSYIYTIQLVLVLLFCNMGLIAQVYHPFPTKNTVWAEYFYPGGGGFDRLYHNYALKDKDTIIHGNRYQKLYHSYDTIFTEDKVCGALREEDKRVYYYSIDSLIYLRSPLSTSIPVDTEIILYDFNLQMGDTITADQYRIRGEVGLIVAKIDSIPSGNELRKRYTFGTLSGSLIRTEQWVEGVGCLRGLLSDIGPVPVNDWGSCLICFIKDGEVLYHSNEFVNCYNTNPNSVQLIKNESKIKVVPNPAVSSFCIELDNIDYQKLIINDQTGRKLMKYNLDGRKTLSIDRSDLPPGNYLFSVYDKKGKVQTLKVVLK